MTRMIYEAIVTEISTKPHPDADRVQLGSTCIKEGICVREETDDGDVVRTLKHKSWIFCALEGIRRNDPDYIDPEEAS